MSDKFEMCAGAVAAWAEHAQQEYPYEACGLIVQTRDKPHSHIYWPCRNLAGVRRSEQFILHPQDWAAAEDAGTIMAVCHSHPDASANPSMADRVMCEKSGLPWFIIGWPSQVMKRVDPEGWQAPLLEREFTYGVLDCYTLIQDYYRRELFIELPDFERDEDGWWEWRDGRAPKTLYRDGFAAAGFVEVNDIPRADDVLLMQVKADVENHGAVFIGDGRILHHLHGTAAQPSLSRYDVYGGYWARVTRAVLRHKQLGGVAA